MNVSIVNNLLIKQAKPIAVLVRDPEGCIELPGLRNNGQTRWSRLPHAGYQRASGSLYHHDSPISRLFEVLSGSHYVWESLAGQFSSMVLLVFLVLVARVVHGALARRRG